MQSIEGNMNFGLLASGALALPSACGPGRHIVPATAAMITEKVA